MSITDLTETTTVAPPGPKAHTVGMVDDVPMGEGRTFVVAGTQVAVFRLRDGSLERGPSAYPQPAWDVRVNGGRVQVRAAA